MIEDSENEGGIFFSFLFNRIEIQTWKRGGSRPGKYAYIKNVIVYIFNKQIRLEQGGRIVVDGLVVRQYYDGHRFSVTVVNQKIVS